MDRRSSARGTRSVFGLLLAAWVSLAIQPCAVAEMSEHSCPHCPTEFAAAPDSGHHHGAAAHHAQALSKGGCESMQADCCDLDEGIVNVRVDSPEFDDVTVVIVGAAPPQLIDVPRVQAEHPAGPPEPPDRPVPIHLFKCVFLI